VVTAATATGVVVVAVAPVVVVVAPEVVVVVPEFVVVVVVELDVVVVVELEVVVELVLVASASIAARAGLGCKKSGEKRAIVPMSSVADVRSLRISVPLRVQRDDRNVDPRHVEVKRGSARYRTCDETVNNRDLSERRFRRCSPPT